MTGASDSDRRRLTRRLDPRLVTAVLALAGMSASFMQTLVIPIQPELPALLSARETLILISGARKREIVEHGGGLPVHVLLEQAKAPVRILWTS